MNDPGFERVLAAEAVSNFGSMLSRLALPWLATLALQAGTMQMAALLLVDVVAGLIGAVALAGWVERSDKRRVMIVCDALRALVLAELAWAAWQGRATMLGLLAAAAATGALTMAFELARSAWMAISLPQADLPRRNAQLSAAGSLSETLAFAIGGWLYQGLGAAWSLLVDALSFVASALCLAPVGRTEATPSASAGRGWRAHAAQALADARAGTALVMRHATLRTVAQLQALIALAMALAGTSFMIFVTRDAGYATGTLGVVFALGALGALLGAWAAPRLAGRWGTGPTMALGLALCAAGNLCVPLAAVGGAAGLVLLAAHQLVGDGGQVVFDIHDRSLRQTVVDAAWLARADAGVRAMGQAATVAGALVGGLAGEILGSRAVLWLAVACLMLAAALAWRRRHSLQHA